MDAKNVEQTLLDRSLPALLPRDQGWVMPHYEGLSIANLPATIAAMLGADLPGALSPLPGELWSNWVPGLRRVVLIVLDALGYRKLQRLWAGGEGQVLLDIADAGRQVPLTSVFPSTTDAALVSLRTGCPPAQHAWLAYTMYLRQMGIAANAILLCPIWTRQSDLLVAWGLKPENLIPVPSLAERLSDSGIATAGVLSNHFRNSGFTKMLYRGVSSLRGHLHASDLWGQTRRTLAEMRSERSLITVYWSGIDTIAHAYGPDSDWLEAEFRSVCHMLARDFLATLSAKDREGTLLLITADHGQIHIPPAHVLTAQEDPELNKHLFLPVLGESRAAFVYPRPGRTNDVRQYLEEAFPGWFTVVESIKALDAGLMGRPIHDEAYSRAGELLVLPNGNHALQHFEPNASFIGRHGGLTAEEMLVPLIGARLEALD